MFQRGQAELVTDKALAKEPLERPGEIVKRLRGTAAEQIAALGPALRGPRGKTEAPKAPKGPKGRTNATPKPPRPKPRPSRKTLDEAEAALAEAEVRHEEALQALKAREAALARECKALEKKQDRERETLEARREKAEAAMRKWRDRARVCKADVPRARKCADVCEELRAGQSETAACTPPGRA